MVINGLMKLMGGHECRERCDNDDNENKENKKQERAFSAEGLLI